MDYVSEFLHMAGRPETHVALIYAAYLVAHIRYLAKRLARLEQKFGVIATPMPLPRLPIPGFDERKPQVGDP
jgi:hypothetical protein